MELNLFFKFQKKKNFYNYDPDIYDAEESEEETTNQNKEDAVFHF